MTNDALKQFVTALYEGRPLPEEPRLTNGCEFRDPVVVVRGAERFFDVSEAQSPLSSVEGGGVRAPSSRGETFSSGRLLSPKIDEQTPSL